MKYLLIFLSVFLVISCTPVRKAYFGGEKNKGNDAQKKDNNNQNDDNQQDETVANDDDSMKTYNENSNKESNFLSDYDDLRFSDTTYIDLGSTMPNRFDESIIDKINMKKSFENALELFDKEKYDEAENKFSYVVGTSLPSEIEAQEAMFHIAECMIGKMNYLDALNELLSLEKLELDDTIKEKILVRIGQIQCVRNNRNDAKKYFDMLREFNPESIYLNVADCNKL